MKLFFSKKIANLFALGILCFSCGKNDLQQLYLSEAGHPRILLAKGEEQQIRDLIDSDDIWKKMHYAILEKSKSFLGNPFLKQWRLMPILPIKHLTNGKH